MKLIWFLLLTVPCLYGQDEVLLHVHAIFRHGDRAPVALLSQDDNKTKFWPNGLGELTDIGIRQHFQLGQWLHRRYHTFLKTKYDNKEIYVRSTDLNRTLMSAESNLAGFYFDKENEIIPGLIWRPVPVHTIPQASDIIMLPEDCKKYNIKKEEMYNTPRFTRQLDKYQSTLDFVRCMTKQPDLQFKDLWAVIDTLFCEKVHNVSWDKWVTAELYKNLTILNKLDWQIMYYGEELQKLSGGLFLNEIVDQLKHISRSSPENRPEKLRIYSGHDTDVAALMSAIGVYDEIQPPYASCFIIELWKKENYSSRSFDNFLVKMYFRNNTEQESTNLVELPFIQCQHNPCPLSEFIHAVKPRTLNLSEYNKACFSTRYLFIILEMIIAIVIIILFIVIITIIYSMCRKPKPIYKEFH